MLSVARLHSVEEELDRGLIEVLPRHLPPKVKENHRERRDSRCPIRDPKAAPPEYRSTVRQSA